MTQHSPAFPGTTLTLETAPNPQDIQALEDRLYEFNVQATGLSDGIAFGLFVRGPDGVVEGGASGWTWGGSCFIRYLVLPHEMRRQGFGTQLMSVIETEARNRGCEQIVLETHSFQARGFYETLGFHVVGEVPEYPRGHRLFMMVKRLGPVAGSDRVAGG
jgi:GNAT superfamily N-acetyltransferase